MNMPDGCLYNPGFSTDNSIVENIVSAKPLSLRMTDTETFQEISEVGDRKTVEVLAELELTWHNSAFNSPTGQESRFALMEKTYTGWKLDSLATGI
jgi:hypothetical protein